jgi:hypothetical protein
MTNPVTPREHLLRLQEALLIAERVKNPFLAANIRQAIKELERNR